MEKFKNIKAKDVSELNEMEAQLRKEALNLRFQQATGELKNTARRRQVRREIAMIKTAVAQKEGSAQKSA